MARGHVKTSVGYQPWLSGCVCALEAGGSFYTAGWVGTGLSDSNAGAYATGEWIRVVKALQKP
jgi:hypothetical protein